MEQLLLESRLSTDCYTELLIKRIALTSQTEATNGYSFWVDFPQITIAVNIFETIQYITYEVNTESGLYSRNET